MSLKHREDSITGIRLREALATKTATSATLVDGSIVLELPEGGVCTGTTVKFKAPCDGVLVTGGLSIEGKQYTVVDSTHKCVTGIAGVWVSGAKIAVILDCEKNRAYIQTAVGVASGSNDSDLAEFHAHIANKTNPHTVTAPQVITSDECATMLEILDAPNVDEGLKALWRLFDMLNRRFIGSDKYIWNMYKYGVTSQTTKNLVAGSDSPNSAHINVRNDIIVYGSAQVVDGEIQFANPKTVTIRATSSSEQDVTITEDGVTYEFSDYVANNVGKFVECRGEVGQLLSNTTASARLVENFNNSGTNHVSYSVTLRLYSVGVPVVAKTYVGNTSSENGNAYPDNEWSGDVFYVKNNISAGIPNIAYGSYTGSGEYGSASKNAVSLPFVPEMVVIQSASSDKGVTLLHGCTGAGGLNVAWNDGEKSVTWYHTSSAADQLNEAKEYRYFAIGKGVYT